MVKWPAFNKYHISTTGEPGLGDNEIWENNGIQIGS